MQPISEDLLFYISKDYSKVRKKRIFKKTIKTTDCYRFFHNFIDEDIIYDVFGRYICKFLCDLEIIKKEDIKKTILYVDRKAEFINKLMERCINITYNKMLSFHQLNECLKFDEGDMVYIYDRVLTITTKEHGIIEIPYNIFLAGNESIINYIEEYFDDNFKFIDSPEYDILKDYIRNTQKNTITLKHKINKHRNNIFIFTIFLVLLIISCYCAYKQEPLKYKLNYLNSSNNIKSSDYNKKNRLRSNKKYYKPNILTIHNHLSNKVIITIPNIPDEENKEYEDLLENVQPDEVYNLIDDFKRIFEVSSGSIKTNVLLLLDNEYILNNKPIIEVSEIYEMNVEPTGYKVIINEGDIYNICEIDGNVDVQYVDIINDELSVVPINIIMLFKSNGWHLYVTDKNLSSTYFDNIFSSVKGVTDYDAKEIYIEDRGSAMDSVVHEMGHAFDFMCGMVSNTVEFKDIYLSEEEIFCDEFNVNFYWDRKEFFAEGFYIYLIQAERLKNTCPLLYNIIDDYVQFYIK